MNGTLDANSLTFWEKVATTRWGAYTTEVEKRLILKARSLARKPTRALEVGCEGGRWSKMLSDLECQMTCIDVDPFNLKLCQERVPSATCILADPAARKIQCDSSSFDLLLCIEVAPVIQSDWFIVEANRLLKDNGVLVCVNWNRQSVRGLFARAAHKFNGSNGDFYKMSYPSWRGSVVDCGFSLVHQEGFCWGPFGRASDSALVPLFVRLERILQLHRLPAVSPWVGIIARKISNRHRVMLDGVS